MKTRVKTKFERFIDHAVSVGAKFKFRQKGQMYFQEQNPFPDEFNGELLCTYPGRWGGEKSVVFICQRSRTTYGRTAVSATIHKEPRWTFHQAFDPYTMRTHNRRGNWKGRPAAHMPMTIDLCFNLIKPAEPTNSVSSPDDHNI